MTLGSKKPIRDDGMMQGVLAYRENLIVSSIMKSKAKLAHRYQPNARVGIRIRGYRGNAEVRRALIRYARWLRANYEFPIRVPVYLFPSEWILTQDRRLVSASFFAPFDRDAEPFIRIATGDYVKLKRKRGRDNALAAFIHSLSHEVVHYRQWVETGDVWERGVITKASAMLSRYAKTVDRP